MFGRTREIKRDFAKGSNASRRSILGSVCSIRRSRFCWQRSRVAAATMCSPASSSFSSRVFSRILKTTRRLLSRSSTPFVVNSAFSASTCRQQLSKQSIVSWLMLAPVGPTARRLSLTTIMDRSTLRRRLCSSVPEESACPSTTTELSSYRSGTLQTTDANLGAKLFRYPSASTGRSEWSFSNPSSFLGGMTRTPKGSFGSSSICKFGNCGTSSAFNFFINSSRRSLTLLVR